MSDTTDPTARRATDPDLYTARRKLEALLRHRVETGGRIEFPDADVRTILAALDEANRAPGLIGPLGVGSTARTLGDANRYDALEALLNETERLRNLSGGSTVTLLRDNVLEAAARVRIAFGIRKS